MALVRSFPRLLFVLATSLFAGCASWTPPMSTEAVPSPQDAYFYGRFKSYSWSPPAWMGESSTTGLIFSCSDGAKYTIRLDEKQPLQVIKVKPATCSFTQIIFTDGDRQIRHTREAPPGLMDQLNVEPGTAYYLGDYSAIWTSTTTFYGSVSGWKITEASSHYDVTTADMKALYPHLTFITTKNQTVDPDTLRAVKKNKEKPPAYQPPATP